MKVILLQNTIRKGERILAGTTIDLEDAVAKSWVNAKLAYATEVAKADEEKKPSKTKKAKGVKAK